MQRLREVGRLDATQEEAGGQGQGYGCAQAHCHTEEAAGTQETNDQTQAKV
jgi:hypothetical protein